MNTSKKTTRFLTPEIVCSFPQLFSVSSYTGKYGLSVVIPSNNKEAVREIKICIANAVDNEWGSKAVKEIGTRINSPLRDGNDKSDVWGDIYNDTVFFSANSVRPPGVVDNKLVAIQDENQIHAGCIIRCTVNFFTYNIKSTRGIACGLQNVMLVGPGEGTGGAMGVASPQNDFSEFENKDQSEPNIEPSYGKEAYDDIPF